MDTFPTARIRNVALIGHQGAGTTTLAEALLHTTGTTARLGRVEDASTVCDFDPEEHRRGLSVGLALAPFVHDGCKVNLLDTPGYADFLGDVGAALAAADLALFVVSAVDGVEVQTQIAWRMAEASGIPRAIFVNKLDKDRASFRRTLDDLKAHFGAGVAPLQLPIGEESALRGVVDLLDDHAIVYADGSPLGTDGPIPDDMAAEEHAVHDALVEGIVVADDALMERYLADEAIPLGELEHALAEGVDAGTVFPVLCGSALRLVGIDRLAHFLVEEAPAPHVQDGDTAVAVFKTIVDQYVGHVNLFKVVQGTLRPDQHLVNVRTHKDERLHQLFTLRGKEQIPVAELAAGDIGAVAKLADVRTGDVLSTGGVAVEATTIETPEPLLAIAIHARQQHDEDKLANALHRLGDEDPVIRVERNPETRQTLLWGTGEMHLAIALSRLAGKFGVEVDTEPPRVAYRETVLGRAEAEGKVKKQSGGHGQFAVACLRVEPLPRGSGVEFVDSIVGGVIPRSFIPAVEKGVLDAVAHGGAHGFPVVDVRVTVFDGKHHSVDSSEMAFKTAAAVGLRDALERAEPIVLEPVSELVITVPESYQGDVMGDLTTRRGRVQGSAVVGIGEVEIVAHVPTSEALRYSIDLRSLTGGRGRYRSRHSHYDPLPAHLLAAVTT